ncbi:MAG: DUF1926 domain-containing protein [Treponema sp.]|nr:DUF1926 domain-containing protein [Treponema sp.]
MKEEINTNRISLILGSHAHVPSGAPESEFEYVYQNKMRPFVSNLYKYSNIHAVLHYSGVLLYWIERTHPEFFMLIEDMVNRKQTEILGGGFYEPMLPLIPLQDRIGQIELMTTYLRKHFGKRPVGCWIPCMAWEQNLANALSASDMNYTFLSQEQFKQSGIKGASLFSPCITEDQGKLITVFPVSLSVEKELSEKSFSQTFIELSKKTREICKQSERMVCVFPDKVSSSAEEAPDTAWNRFFEEISLSEDIVETVLPSKIIKNHKIYRKASFQNSSAVNDFSPRRFLIEHEEANGIYSKMIFTNVLINHLKGDKSRKVNAREELWKAQDSSLYSGFQYRNELRKAAYSSLIRAEKMSKEKEKIVFSIIQHDFDFDGINEYLLQDSQINCYIRQKGAVVFELDYLPKEWNYLDCGTDEARLRRTAFADMLLPQNTNLEDIIKEKPKGARLCYNEYYESSAQNRKGKSCFKLNAIAEDIPFNMIEIDKCYMLKKDVLSVSYMIKNTGKETQNFVFIPEINLSFAGVTDELVRFYAIEASGTAGLQDTPVDIHFNASNLKIHDVKNEVQLLLAFTGQGSSLSVNGCLVPAYSGNVYQGTRILPAFALSLNPDETWKNDFSLKFSH